MSRKVLVVPKKGKSHVLRVVRELLYTRPEKKGTSIKAALDYLLKVAKRKSVVFLISDFLDDQYWSSLKVVNRKHDLIGIYLYDPAEIKLPKLGLAKVEDPETGSAFWIDTSSEKALKVSKENPKAYVIGSDNMCTLDEKIFDKPIDHKDAVNHLQALSGNKHLQNNANK